MANPRFWVCLPMSIHQRPARPKIWCTSLLDAWESDVTGIISVKKDGSFSKEEHELLNCNYCWLKTKAIFSLWVCVLEHVVGFVGPISPWRFGPFLCMDLFTLTFGQHFLLLQIGFGSCSLSLMNLDVPPPKALALEKESRCFTLFQLLLSCWKYLSSFGVSLPRFVWSIQSDATWRGGLSWI